MKHKNEIESHSTGAPHHSKEVEAVAHQIIWYGIGAALICTLIVWVM